jgi:DNA-binding NarL/FixJ family response regulator
MLKPDAVVHDISMSCMSGLEEASRLSDLPIPPRIMFLTVHEDQDFIDAAEGASSSGLRAQT